MRDINMLISDDIVSQSKKQQEERNRQQRYKAENKKISEDDDDDSNKDSEGEQVPKFNPVKIKVDSTAKKEKGKFKKG